MTMTDTNKGFMPTRDLGHAYSIEVFPLDDEDDDDEMHAFVARQVRDAKRCALCGEAFREDDGDDDDDDLLGRLFGDGPAAAYIARPMPSIPHKRRPIRVGPICAGCAERMTDREIDRRLARFAPAWAQDDEVDEGN
jgi:hypothetical protein